MASGYQAHRQFLSIGFLSTPWRMPPAVHTARDEGQG